MPDIFEEIDRRRIDLIAPCEAGEVADHSSSDHAFTNTTRQVLVTTNGNLTVRMAGNAADITFAVRAGWFAALRITHVRQASTAGIVGFW